MHLIDNIGRYPKFCDCERDVSVYRFLQRNQDYLCFQRDVEDVFKGPGEFLDGFAARGEEACGCGDVDVRDEQPLFTVWLVAEQRPIGPHHRRSGRRPSACKVYRREIAGVFGGAA